MRTLLLTAMGLVVAATAAAAQTSSTGWAAVVGRSPPAAPLPRETVRAMADSCAITKPDSVVLVPARADSAGRVSVLDGRGQWTDAQAGTDTFTVRLVGIVCGGRGDSAPALVMESGGRFLKYTPPAGADTLPVARGQWGRSDRWPHGTVALAYGPALGWLGPAHILHGAGPWTPEQTAAAREHRVLMGMHRWMVWIALGRPVRSNLTVWNGAEAEEWTYPNGTVDFRGDTVSAIRLN